MNDRRLVRTSKFLSLILRHHPETIGLTLDEAGWVDVDELIAAANRSGRDLTRELIDEVVAKNDKQRFRFNDDGTRIRASQGHSVAVELQLESREPPATLYHGTVARFLDSIRSLGLIKGSRQHVHLSAERGTAERVGQRRGRPVVLEVDATAMHTAGHAFYLSDNDVWLADHVPPEFLEFPE